MQKKRHNGPNRGVLTLVPKFKWKHQHEHQHSQLSLKKERVDEKDKASGRLGLFQMKFIMIFVKVALQNCIYCAAITLTNNLKLFSKSTLFSKGESNDSAILVGDVGQL